MALRMTGLALASLLILSGCTGTESDTTEYAAAEINVPENDGHADEGPHGGHILEFSANHEYHGEVVFDADSRNVVLYVLGSDLETPVPVPTEDVEFELEDGDDEIVLALTADPLPGEDNSIASRFVVAASEIPESVHDIEELHAHIHITIDGTEYSAGLDHGHDHAHEHGASGHDDEEEDHDAHEGHDDDGDGHEEGHDREGHDDDDDDHKEGHDRDGR